jgi:glycosyltransferase involved in cell wall biosynthesis
MDGLVTMGHEAHFAYVVYEPVGRGDVAAMAAAWGDRFHLFDPQPPHRPTAGRPIRRVLKRFSSGVVRLVKYRVSYRAVRWLEQRSLAVALAAHRVETVPIDSSYDDRLTPPLRDLHRRYQFDVVIVVYAMFTRAFEAFGPDVLRVLDAQDCFSQRTLDLLREGMPREIYVPVTRREEAKGLRRADVILSLREDDEELFRGLARREVVTVGPLTAVAATQPEPAAPVILCVGSAFQLNADGVRWYLDKVYPRVRAVVPDSELWLAGGVGGMFTDLPAGVRCLGFVPDLGDVYRRSAVVINPVLAGSGIAIKSIEAMAAGRPLIATRAGARGLAAAVAAGVAVTADDPAEFATAVTDLLCHPARRDAMAAKARAYCAQQNLTNMERYAGVIDRRVAERRGAKTGLEVGS